MRRVLSVFTNCYGPDGVRAAVRHVRAAGFDHVTAHPVPTGPHTVVMGRAV